MTSLHFVGDLPVWLGLVLSLLVATLAWRYYRRESYDLTPRLRWILPALRATAFFLGIMILTGPVLHHRETIGELGRVKIYVDASQSMNLHDRHISTGRKLLIAEQQGWLELGQINSKLFEQANAIREVRETVLVDVQQDDVSADGLMINRDKLMAVARKAVATVGAADTGAESAIDGLQTAISQLQSLSASDPASVTKAVTILTEICDQLDTVADKLDSAFEASVQRLVDSGDASVQASLAMFDDTTRWRRAERSLLETSGSLFGQLRENHNVEVLALQNQLAVELLDGQAIETAPQQLSQTPDSTTTDLTSGITATQKATATSEATEFGGETLTATGPNTAIVLLTDGQHNSGPSPLQAARVLGRQGVAFFPVSMGATQQAPDLAVTKVENPQLVFRKDRVCGTMTIRDRMPAGQAMIAAIHHEGEVIWQKQLLTDGTGDRRIEFEFGIEELVSKLGEQFDSEVKQHAVPVAMEASVSLLPNEAEIRNNQLPLRFAAVTQGYRMLIIDGRSRWETRYLRNAFERDSQWHVTAVIAGPGTDDETLPRGDGDNQFPENRDDLFTYDIIIFGEIAPEMLAEYEYQWIREFAEIRGGGIVFVDGQRGRMKKFTQQSLSALLPVEWQAAGVSSLPTTLQLSNEGSRIPALAFETDQQANRQFWNELPPPHTLNAVTALPGAEVLVEAVVDGTKMPMMVTRNYGSGRILYLASDETWRWRYKAADIYHQRIWNQLAKYVMPRPFTASDNFLAIDTGSVSYSASEEAAIRIRLKGLDGKPSTGSTVDALVWKDGRTVSTVSLTEDPDVPGMYRGNSGSLTEGDYEVSIRASGFSQEALKAKGRFVVRPQDSGELEQTACNEQLLQQMAAESGGVYLREEQLGRLADLLSPFSSGRVVLSNTVLWQSYWWFAAMIGLLAVEWFLRKRAGLL